MTTTTINAADSNVPSSLRAKYPWVGRAMWLSLTLLLCVTNSLTLLDQELRNSAYNVIARISASPILHAAGLSSLTTIVQERDPAALEQKAVERATMRLAENSTLLLRDITALKAERTNLIAERKTLQQELRVSRALIAVSKDRIVNLGKRVLGRAGRSVTRHIVSLPGHALPVLSASVAVASVGFDLNDACESLKELDEVNQSVGLPAVDRSKVCGVTVPTADELLADARTNWRSAYARSAEVLNSGAQMLPRSPPSVSFESSKNWLSAMFR